MYTYKYMYLNIKTPQYICLVLVSIIPSSASFNMNAWFHRLLFYSYIHCRERFRFCDAKVDVDEIELRSFQMLKNRIMLWNVIHDSWNTEEMENLTIESIHSGTSFTIITCCHSTVLFSCWCYSTALNFALSVYKMNWIERFIFNCVSLFPKKIFFLVGSLFNDVSIGS